MSTKFGVYEDDRELLVRNIQHAYDEIEQFESVAAQREFREKLLLDTLATEGVELNFGAVIGRMGLLGPIAGGVYEVNRKMYDALHHPFREHPCNLGPIIAYDLANSIEGCRALTADSGQTDELLPVSRLTGTPLVEREAFWHTLNQKAVARAYAKSVGKRYDELDLVVCHLGGGTSVAAHQHGRAIDTNNGMGDEGPFSVTRVGSLPVRGVIDLCFSGKYSKAELYKFIFRGCGVQGHLGTSDMFDVMERVEAGDEKATLIIDALILNTAKEIAAMSASLSGHVDAILLTGGLANVDYISSGITRRVSHIAPVALYPGEDEMEALAQNALGALRGELPLKTF